MKGRADHAITIAHHTEAFARTKRLKPLAKLLEPELPPKAKKATGANKVSALFERIKAQQERGG